MPTASNDFSYQAPRFLTHACALVVAALLPACGNSVAPATDEAAHAQRDPEADATPDAASDRAVDVFEAGAGDTTVVFEAGFGNDRTSWEQVASEVSAVARVFAYSRPGYGQSDPSDEPRDANHIVEDLRALLATRGFAPPYVLVGHSFGGTYMELFAKAHPTEVSGLVLVDPRHRDFTTTCEQAGFDGCGIPASVVASLPPVQVAEYAAFARTSDEIRAAGAFGAYPVRVLIATSHGFGPEVEALWQSMLGSLADEAADGEHIVFDGAGHGLQVERPDAVADVIMSLVSQAP